MAIPYTWPHRAGWIPLRGLHRSRTFVQVHVDLSTHWVSVTKFGKPLYGFRAGTGASYSSTPVGRYFVTDRIPFYRGSVLGSFAFGISGIQPHLPPGWSGGDQLAIHGTNEPWTIGKNASAGCVHVSERRAARAAAHPEAGHADHHPALTARRVSGVPPRRPADPSDARPHA